MSPNTRKRKSSLVNDLADLVEEWDITKEDQVDVILQLTKKLGIHDDLFSTKKPTRSGRAKIPLATRHQVWKYWHDSSTPFTLSSRPASLRCTDKPKIQSDLNFVDTTTIITKRNRNFYQSQWFITNLTIKELYQKYLSSHPEYLLSYGSFLALKPFYVRSATTKDIEMCCCKKHLHARWVIKALIENCSKQHILIDFHNYKEFFEYLTASCKKEESTYIDWQCTPHKKQMCIEIQQKWNTLKTGLIEKSDPLVTVNFQYFEVEMQTLLNGKTVKKLKALSKAASIEFIATFIDKLLPSIIHHRNQLKHYRNTVHEVHNFFNAAVIDVDFSENLNVPVKYEPQSLHWSHEQVTVHSAIMKFEGEKTYHPYLSDERRHDQHFVHTSIEKILEELDKIPDIFIIESDNCSQQYKSAIHFYYIQEVSNKHNCTIIRIYGIAEHGKGEVDHVGGLAKTSLRRAIAAGKFFNSTEEMVEYLEFCFGESVTPKYIPKYISSKEINKVRDENRLIQCHSIEGSSQFQVMVFKPNCSSVKAAPRLCVCNFCQYEYGSCELFQEYPLNVTILSERLLRSEVEENETKSSVAASEFLLTDTFCAVAADKKSNDTMWFIMICELEKVAENDCVDDYGFQIAYGQKSFSGHFAEQIGKYRGGLKFKTQKHKKTYFYKESVIYQFVNFSKVNDDVYSIDDLDFYNVLCYVEHFGIAPL